MISFPRNGFPVRKILGTSLIGALALTMLISSLGWSAPRTNPDPTYMVISLAWVGSPITSHQLDHLQSFRQEFSSISIHHFVHPDHLFKEASKIKKAIGPEDSVGLYVSPSTSLLRDAKVNLRRSPTFWSLESTNIDHNPTGRSTPLSQYNAKEIGQIIESAKHVFTEEFKHEPHSVMIGGWVDSLTIRESLMSQGIPVNFSAINPLLVKPRLKKFPLYSSLIKNWPIGVQLPFTKNTDNGSRMLYIPQTGGALDYLRSSEIIDIFREISQTRNTGSGHAKVFQILIHHSSMTQYLGSFRNTMQELFKIAHANHVNLRPLPAGYTRRFTAPN